MKLTLSKSVIFILMVFVVSMAAKPKKQVRIASGAWGGQNITMKVDEKSAAIEFDCARGTIEGPLMVNSNGQFNWKGTFSAERGGPVRIDEKSNGKPANYSGTIKGQSMTLTVSIEGEKEPLDTFKLTHGAVGRLRKCM